MSDRIQFTFSATPIVEFNDPDGLADPHKDLITGIGQLGMSSKYERIGEIQNTSRLEQTFTLEPENTQKVYDVAVGATADFVLLQNTGLDGNGDELDFPTEQNVELGFGDFSGNPQQFSLRRPDQFALFMGLTDSIWGRAGGGQGAKSIQLKVYRFEFA